MEINLEFLMANNLTPNEFVILFILLTYKSNKSAMAEFTALGMERKDIISLLDRDLVTESKGKYTTTELTKEMLTDGNSFMELLDLYPTKVVRPDGKTAYLKKDRSRMQTKYYRITRNRIDIHNHIMKCLKYEIRERTKTGDMKWMQTLPNWLHSEGWLEWQDKLKEKKFDPIENEEIKLPYGTELI